MMHKRLLPLLCLLPFLLASTSTQAGIETRTEVNHFIQEMVRKHNMSERWLKGVFAHTEIQQSIIDAMNRPAEKTKEWHEYRAIFLTDKRIQGGVKFWNDHAKLLSAIEQRYQVPAEIIVGIIGVETQYGGNIGHYKVIDALSTLSFDYPKRGQFFRRQLEEFLLLCREEKLNPREPVGSYAGAMGLPQFIPSSLRSFAVDHDNDGRHDLWNSPGDILASVANYFVEHRWQSGEPITMRANLTKAVPPALVKRDFKPHATIESLAKLGITPSQFIEPDKRVGVLQLQGSEGPETWLTAYNFYVITRYNHSPMYAMAVYQLSEAIRSARAEQQVR